MTLETARHDRPAEIQSSISVAGTVDPTTDFGPVRHRQLKELIVFPVEISLAFAARTDDEIEAFGERDRVGWRSEHADLEEAIAPCFHAITQLGFESFENVLARREAARDRRRGRFA